ncbi:acyltransferase [Nocardioides sp. zg-DK7169]|uniref:acyltransferase family protein n=1 Tax=Nocardioides sp. zg-DK7169 TaxID=2736600 RepID=UPI001557A05C|nr:acyltransferase [Nocardioides sp. zg-DK7169]NPC99010.1 acyltransferase [Nocardioides sp. zg-DK7169]
MTSAELRLRGPQPHDPVDPAATHVASLDGVRAVAVLAVVAFHAREDLMPSAYIGVDLFFVLSGFLITGILAREVGRTGRVALGRFYLRRALRLFPALLTVCLVAGLVFWLVPGLAHRDDSLLGIFTALTYTSSPVAASGTVLGWMLHTWSLAVEEYFYLVWPLALVLVARRRRPVVAVALLTGLAVVWRLLAAYATDWSPARIYYAPDTRAEQLLIGCLLALLLRAGMIRVGSRATTLAALSFVLFSLLPGELGQPLYLGGGSTLVALAAAVLIAGLVQHPDQPLARLGSTPLLGWIGRRSYGLYLWNLPVVGVVVASPLPGPLMVPAQVVLTFTLAALSFRLVEQPFLRAKDRVAAPV